MQTAPHEGLPGNEWDVVNDLLAHPPDDLDAILKWIFTEHVGYVEPRARAGLRFVERNPTEGLVVIEQLISSSNSDDRDTAIAILERYGQSSVFHLARPLLQDPYPYLRFDAVELLRDIYPEEVKATLREMAEYKAENWVRELAQNKLREMGENT